MGIIDYFTLFKTQLIISNRYHIFPYKLGFGLLKTEKLYIIGLLSLMPNDYKEFYAAKSSSKKAWFFK